MYIVDAQDRNFMNFIEKFLNQSRIQNQNISGTVTKIMEEVKLKKNKALINFTKEFDKINLKPENLLLSEEEISMACDKVSNEQKHAIDQAKMRIQAFHERQLPKDEYWVDKSGVGMGWGWQPIERVGIYVPGGTASYPSSVLMNAIPAIIAGTKKIVMTTPISNKGINPLVIYAAKILKISEIYKLGGAQAVGALAYGTETIGPVDKIVGPGNAFVAEAKRQVFGRVGIDMVAGPSEVVVIADSNNKAGWIVADLLSQAEHDENAQAILITDSTELAIKVEGLLNEQISNLNRGKIAEESLKKNGAIITVKTLDEAATISNKLAPEHLQLCVENPRKLVKKIKNAGSIFLGRWTPEVLGDYIIGTNHVLPTCGSSRFSSGLSVLDFMKRSFISEVKEGSIQEIGESASILANAEGLGGHAYSVGLRILEAKN